MLHSVNFSEILKIKECQQLLTPFLNREATGHFVSYQLRGSSSSDAYLFFTSHLIQKKNVTISGFSSFSIMYHFSKMAFCLSSQKKVCKGRRGQHKCRNHLGLLPPPRPFHCFTTHSFSTVLTFCLQASKYMSSGIMLSRFEFIV